MAERKPRATREEALKAKIETNLAAQAKLFEELGFERRHTKDELEGREDIVGVREGRERLLCGHR